MLKIINKILGHVNFLKKGLDGAALRNQVISSNIANADTEGYRAKDVRSEKLFHELIYPMNTSEAIKLAEKSINFGKDIDEADFQVVERTGYAVKSNGNNVDLEKEMAELAKNSILYNALVQKISMELRRIEYAINEGKG